jgi:hypothetical protein
MTTRPAAGPAFLYDALRKVAVARGTDRAGRAWTIEFHGRRPDDSMEVVVVDPSDARTRLTVTEDDFAFGADHVALAPLPDLALRMEPLYLKKLRGFARGNIPTPDVPGPSLP